MKLFGRGESPEETAARNDMASRFDDLARRDNAGVSFAGGEAVRMADQLRRGTREGRAYMRQFAPGGGPQAVRPDDGLGIDADRAHADPEVRLEGSIELRALEDLLAQVGRIEYWLIGLHCDARGWIEKVRARIAALRRTEK